MTDFTRPHGSAPNGITDRVRLADIPGGEKRVPLRALVLSLAALAAAAWGALSQPQFLAAYDALSWLLVLAPAFLLAYYRGWRGAMRALAAGSVLVLLGQLTAEHVLEVSTDWFFLFLIAVALLGIGLGIGVLSELLERERRHALLLAYSDPLTGLPNRRLLEFALNKEFAAARRGRPLTVTVIEVDGYAAYVQEHGRVDAERMLAAVATVVDRNTRLMNVSGRYADSRFLSMLSGDNVDGAWVFAERLRAEVEGAEFDGGRALTVSCGITSFEQWMRMPGELLSVAEDTLKRAHQRGGNCVVYQEPVEERDEVPPAFKRLPEDERRKAERKWRQQALEEAEIRYRRLFDGVPVGLYRFAPDGQILDVNPALVRMLGYPDQVTLVSRNALQLHADPAGDRPWESMVGRRGTVRDYEVRLRRYDGSELWARNNIRAVIGRDGRVRYYQGAFTDITERKQVEQELRDANEKLRALIDAAPIAILSLDLSSRIMSWNPAAERIFGWPASAVLGRTVPFVPDERRAEYEDLFRRAASGEYLAGLEIRRQRSDGTPIDLRLWAAPLFSNGDISGILAMMVDISAQKRVEQERVLLATVVEQGAEAIVITDVDGAIQYVNPAFERITGYSRLEVLGRNPRILSSGRHEADFYRRLWETLKRGEAWSGHFINRRKDGTLYRQEGTISPVRDASGKTAYYVGVGRDVTRELELESQLRQAQKMEAVGQLAGGVAHDFNNLLTAILGNSELLLSDLDLDDRVRDFAAEIRDAGERAAALTRQLLAFSRRQVVQPELLDVNLVVEEITGMIRRILGAGVSVITELDEGVGAVRADRTQIEQIMVNLAVNARDAMPEGGVITIRTAEAEVKDATDLHIPVAPGRYVTLSVSDAGTGIDESTLARIFEPFFTTKERGKGTGLGLSTVYGIVRSNSGSIAVDSQPGRGSTFTVYLPRAADEPLAEPAASAAPAAETVSGTVMVVDDEDSVRTVIVRTLERAGYQVLSAADPQAALRLNERHPQRIDLLIVDVVLPGISGFDLAERVRARRPDTPLLFISGLSDESVGERLRESGAAILNKPFSREALLRRVRETLVSGRAD